MKSIIGGRLVMVMVLVVLAVSAMVLPGFAQDAGTTASVDSLSVVTGAVTFSATGDIVVAGVTIAPAGAFNPSILHEGDLVIITGLMVGDKTMQAVTFEFFDDEQQPEATPPVDVTPEVTPESTLEVTPEVTPEATLEVTPEVTPEATQESDCNGPNQPVGMRIAETFNVSYDEVMALHCQGIGFGNIIRAYLLAEKATDGSTAQDFLDRHANGEGWGQIMRDSDISPSELAPGKVLKHLGGDISGELNDTGAGGNGHGHGNGGNGHGHGNGNGGNGHGNGHGNGNGG
jgi:hypothetical protein